MTTSSESRTSSASSEMLGNVFYREDSPIVFDYVTASGPDGIKFDSWFGNSHLPNLISEHGRDALSCYAVPSRSSYLSIIELKDAGNPSSSISKDQLPPASLARHEHFVCDPLGITQRRHGASNESMRNAITYPAFLNVPEEKMEEVSRWYEKEHLPFLMECPEWLMTRRFRLRSPGNGFTHLAIHYLKDLKALKSPQRDAARNTPWRDALIGEGWFAPEYRVCYPLKVLPA